MSVCMGQEKRNNSRLSRQDTTKSKPTILITVIFIPSSSQMLAADYDR